MRVLELFSGTGVLSKTFRDNGHEAIAVDIQEEERIQPDIKADIASLHPDDLPHDSYDVVWASPPCPKFSVARLYDNWKDSWVPKNEDAVDAISIVYRTLWIIHAVDPDWWFVENPRGMLRNLLNTEPRTVMYCQYGFDWQKPTDLFGEHPPSMEYRTCSPGADCHQEAGRGFDTGTQASHIRDEVERSQLPRQLCESVVEACENPGEKPQQTIHNF